MVCETFDISPLDAEELDEDFTYRLIRARLARLAARTFETKDAKMTEAQQDAYRQMLNALDARDERLGVPEVEV